MKTPLFVGALLDSILECFEVQVGGVGDSFGVYFGSCRTQVGVWEAKTPQGRGLEGLGLAQGRLGIRKWAQQDSNLRQVGANLGQHGSNLSQLGANLGPSWIQIGSSKPI